MFSLKSLGLDPEALQQQAQAAFEALRCELEGIKQELAALRVMQGFEYGQVPADVTPHDPRVLPFVTVVEVPGTPGSSERVNLAAALGKTVTRGHITNVGSAKAIVRFIQDTVVERGVDYLLLPGTTIDFSWFFDELEVREAGDGEVEVQVLAQ